MYDLFEYPIDEELAQRLIGAFRARMKKKDSLVLGVYSIEEQRLSGVIEAYDLQDDGSACIGYRICPAVRRRGYGSEAVSVFGTWLLDNGCTYLRASASKDNTASRRILEKNGFVQTGTAGDQIIYRRYR